jgi:hypothetical protein
LGVLAHFHPLGIRWLGSVLSHSESPRLVAPNGEADPDVAAEPYQYPSSEAVLVVLVVLLVLGV